MVEIGCIEVVNRVPTGAVFHAYFNPERDMPAGAEAVHGLSAAFLADKPLFAARADELLQFLGDAPLVAHNATFDFGFLNAELEGAGRTPVCTSRMVDTLVIARRRHPGAKLSLDALCTRYGVDRSHRVQHGALLDAELLAQVYLELTGGRQIGLELAADMAGPANGDPLSEPAGATAFAAATRSGRTTRPPRPHAASPEELERHAAFLQLVNAPLWHR